MRDIMADLGVVIENLNILRCIATICRPVDFLFLLPHVCKYEKAKPHSAAITRKFLTQYNVIANHGLTAPWT